MSELDTETPRSEAVIDKILRLPEVLKIFGGSTSSLKRAEDRGECPKRFHPWEGSNAVGWWESEWIERQQRLKLEHRSVEDQRPRDAGRFVTVE